MNKKTSKQLRLADIIARSLYTYISDEERQELDQWIAASEQNKKFYQQSRSIDKSVISEKIEAYQKINISKAKENVLNRSDIPAVHRINRNWLKYAALFVGFIGLAYFYTQNFYNKSQQVISIAEDNITLELANGDIKIISADGKEKIIDKKGSLISEQEGDRLNYANNNNVEGLVYNTLSIPYGKKFELVLSDGTEVYLNAGTTLKYPVKFIEGQSRKVFLEGEAFFNVTHNDEDSFIVNANDLNTKVFGTSFNISSYPEDAHTKVVLVEGKVGVYKLDTDFHEEEDTYLLPSNMAVYGADRDEIKVCKVDTSIYTAWMDNTLIFKSETFESIFKKLERHYNVKIINNLKLLEKEKFTGTFQNKDVDYLLEVIKANTNFEYEINQNQIIIN